MINLYAPKYYGLFKCIADKCTHNCCIGWEIDVDPEAMEKYLKMDFGYGAEIKQTIDNEVAPHFRLGKNDRCPHLDENGLCRIISELGEGYLCEICREHPRFYNFTPHRAEVGLGMACEEACKMILHSDQFNNFTVIECLDGETYADGFDPIKLRQIIFDILSDSKLTHLEKLKKISELCYFDKNEYSNKEITEMLESLEYMSEENKAMICDYSCSDNVEAELEKPLERAIAYFVYRHCTKAEDESEFYEILRFALLCYSILVSIAVKKSLKTADDLIPYARMVSEELEYSEDNTATLIEKINI